jgi:HNH endonuclease
MVFARAQGYCEYCQSSADFTTEPFSIEHIQPRAKEGLNDSENLALACLGCNIFKSDKTTSLDPITQQVTPLFNPRTMDWHIHFTWDETFTIILGKSPIGRSTIETLKLNRRQLINLRRALIAIGEHPPKFE